MLKLSVSVIINCHNLHQYLNEAVESVKNQTMSPTEIIVIHDNCEPAPAFKGTTTVFRDTHKGVAVSRDEGVRLSSCDSFIFLDADDVLDEYFIEAMVKTYEKTHADIIYPNVLLWSSWHKEVKLKNGWHESPNKISWKKMMEYNQVVVSCLITKRIYGCAGPMKNLPILEDYEFFLRCMTIGASFRKSPMSILKYRQRADGRNRQNHELKNQIYQEIKKEYESAKS